MNVLLVDDQPQILSSLLNRINWSDLDVTQIQTATSALAAKNIISKGGIDILISDIEMPVENGLSLLTWIRENKYDLECIFLTSHVDFFFAQQAIDLGAINYILQPASDEDIIHALDNAKLRIIQKQRIKSALKYSRFSSSAQNTVIQNFFNNWPDPEAFLADPGLLAAKWNSLREIGIDCPESQNVTLAASYITRWCRLPQRPVEYLPQFNTKLEQVLSFLNLMAVTYYTNDNIIFSVIFGEMSEALLEHIGIFQEDFSHTMNCTMHMCACNIPPRNIDPALDMLNQYFQNPDHTSPSSEKAPVHVLEYSASDTERMENVPDSLTDYLSKIKEYIRENLDQAATRTQIAQYLHLSPDYVSYIVRKGTGNTLKELIIHEKMAYAKHMLENTDMPIGDISTAIGFNSFAYFSKVYKDTYHVTPSQSRQKS